MISDPRWEESFVKGQVIEDGTFNEYRIILMQIDEAIGIFDYPYRMFFFKEGETIPILILSLEVGRMFGTCALGAHNESMHKKFGDANVDMTLEEFKSWALSIAPNELLQTT